MEFIYNLAESLVSSYYFIVGLIILLVAAFINLKSIEKDNKRLREIIDDLRGKIHKYESDDPSVLRPFEKD